MVHDTMPQFRDMERAITLIVTGRYGGDRRETQPSPSAFDRGNHITTYSSRPLPGIKDRKSGG
jgi:hypothetical protein